MASSTTAGVKALLFDVFGTVVDWRGSIIRQCTALGRAKGLRNVNWEAFADAWRAGYRPAMARVRSGELPWTPIDDLHRLILDGLLRQFGIGELNEAEIRHLNLVWHRLRPWPDARAGLRRLKRGYIVAPLSNGNLSLLVDLARYGSLPWDCVFSAEIFHHYKPDPETYLGAARLLGLAPHEVMMVATHKDDLYAAKASGLRTAFVPRRLEFGPHARYDAKREAAFDVHARDFAELADRLPATRKPARGARRRKAA